MELIEDLSLQRMEQISQLQVIKSVVEKQGEPKKRTLIIDDSKGGVEFEPFISNRRSKSLTKSQTRSFLENIYCYPPKFTVKYDKLDEFQDDLFLPGNYGVLEHSIPFMDFIEDWFFLSDSVNSQSNKYSSKNYSRTEYIEGFLDKLNTSNFYKNKTKVLQEALRNVPVFIVLNGHGEIVLNGPSNIVGVNLKNLPTVGEKLLYDYCGAFDLNVASRQKLGLFFLNLDDAEIYLQEIAKTDRDGTETLGLSIHRIGLDSAYKIVREHHPGIDFRFVPNFSEVKDLLADNMGTSDMIVEDEQQQLRFRPRHVNLFSNLGKLGQFITSYSSFLQRNEYFKGTPIYIVQTLDEPRNLLFESCYVTLGILDTVYSRFIQYLDYTIGFGHNWIMQGSITEKSSNAKLKNFVFFNKKQAAKFVRDEGRRITRYQGSRTSNLEFLIKKPKIFVHNLEDFLEFWEDAIQHGLINQNQHNIGTIFDAKATYFIPPSEINLENNNIEKNSPTFVDKVKQQFNVKYRFFKRSAGVIFSM